jgi:antitoxin (DNA-binding transcriptional repressor) of toxin-antitoxin stability system
MLAPSSSFARPWSNSTREPDCYNNRMSNISVQDIERDPLAFLRRVEAGESFLVVRGERPLAEVRPLPAPATQPRPFGLCAGRFTVPADFDQPLPDEVLKAFVGP